MRIVGISAFAVKAGQRYQPLGQTTDSPQLPGSDYLRFHPLPQLYSQRAEAVVVRVDTDEGLSGWGECQAPVGPEIVQTVIGSVLGPAVLGRDPLAVQLRYQEMLGTNRVRGHGSGYQVDAIAGLDTAFWDLRGQVHRASLSELLGGPCVDTLPCYVTGLRGASVAARQDEARSWADQGIGVKPCLGLGAEADIAEITAIREAVEDRARLMVDGMWSYGYGDAVEVARVLARLGVEFFESPMDLADVAGHARLARAVDVPVAIGEALRTRTEFLPWLQAGALALAQPDLMRNGVTETVKIATLAEAFGVPVALHTGCSTVVGMAATWGTAAALGDTLVQELQPVMLDQFNPWLTEPLTVVAGRLVPPSGSGLGITIDLERFTQDVDSVVRVGRPF